jgi:hypothetical protein
VISGNDRRRKDHDEKRKTECVVTQRGKLLSLIWV